MDGVRIQATVGRVFLFLVVSAALLWGLEFIVPLSSLIMRDLFLPFVSHPHLPLRGPWMYIANGGFVAVVAAVSVLVGRRFSLLANIGVFLGIAVIGSIATHITLQMFGYPFQGDAP
jgi:hypothetical protein